MLVPYRTIINTVYNTILGNDLFNPSSIPSERLINRLEKVGTIPGEPFPAVTIEMMESADEWRTLGYTPWHAMRIKISAWCRLPSSPTSRMLTDLGLSSITTEWESEQEMYYLAEKLTEWLRGDETEAGNLRRTLGLKSLSEVNVGVPTLSVSFKRVTQGNFKLRIAEILATFPHIKIN